MSRPSLWIVTPDDAALGERRNWAALGGGLYEAVRLHVLVVPRNGRVAVKGRARDVRDLPAGTKLGNTVEVRTTATHTDVYRQSLGTTVSERVSRDVLTRMKSARELSGEAAGGAAAAFKAAFKDVCETERQTRTTSEITTALQASLERTQSFTVAEEVAITDKVEIELSPQAAAATIRYTAYPLLREHFWDVFLCRAEYLRVREVGRLLWFPSRHVELAVDETLAVPLPLCTLTWYVAHKDLSITAEPYTAEVDEDTRPVVGPMAGPPLLVTPPPDGVVTAPLVTAAREAFPSGLRERRQARQAKHERAQKVAKIAGRNGGTRASGHKSTGTAKSALGKSAAQRAATKGIATKRSVTKKIAGGMQGPMKPTAKGAGKAPTAKGARTDGSRQSDRNAPALQRPAVKRSTTKRGVAKRPGRS